MVNLSTFQEYLATDTSLLRTHAQSINSNEPHLRQWAALLPAKTEAQQAEQIEKVLTELRSAHIDDRQRLTLIRIVINATNPLIAALRQHYIYETGALNEAQLEYVAQVRSLYYSMIMTYHGVIYREIAFLEDKRQQPSSSLWQRYFTSERSLPITLAIAIYQTLLMYQKLLFEDAICYQKLSFYIWDHINQLYRIALTQQASAIDLSAYIATQSASTIHNLYCQLCLHHLLNVRALRRSHILLLHRLLPEWSEHMVATIEPRTATRLFVDLQSKEPPTYLTALTAINPYDAHHTCLFIELESLMSYLQSRIQTLFDTDKKGIEYYLTNTILMAMSYRYIQPKLTFPINHNVKQAATIVTGFNDIHYRVSNGKSLSALIKSTALPDHQQPRYDTLPKILPNHKGIAVEIFENEYQLSQFRILRLLPKPDEVSMRSTAYSLQGNKRIAATTKMLIKTADIKIDKTDNLVFTAPPSLQTMSLFLLCRKNTTISPSLHKWSMGVVRWLNVDDMTAELDWQVLGHKLIACGIRLQDREERSRHFVPAFIIGEDEQLQTSYSLLLPTSHFQTDDKVVMRINNQQKTLRLGRRLMMSDEFIQYEILQV